jgi:hypothetical protein
MFVNPNHEYGDTGKVNMDVEPVILITLTAIDIDGEVSARRMSHDLFRCE